MATYGFIGMGNMAQAFLKGMTKFAGINPGDIYAYAPNQEKLHKNAELLGFNPVESYNELIQSADTIIIACKPYQIEDVFEKITRIIGGSWREKNWVSLAAGWYLKDYAKYGIQVQCIMPNTPCSVGEGVILVENDYSLNHETRTEILEMMSAFSKVIEMPGHLIDAGSAISGCAPAFVDLFIEALSDGAVKNGIPRSQTYEIITQMMVGSAKLCQESGLHPGVLKDQVCSPGGTTIKGIAALEKGGFRSAVIEAVDAVLK